MRIKTKIYRLCFVSVKSQFKKLLETGTEVIAEAASYDRIWGIGLSATEAVKVSQWPGQNLLGQILMEIRSNL